MLSRSDYHAKLTKLKDEVEGNSQCFECGSRLFEQFSVSIYLGIFLCMRHSTSHVNFGRRISFIKEANCGTWNAENLVYVETGGNTRFMRFLKRRNLLEKKFTKSFYLLDEITTYKRRIESRVLKRLESSERESKALLSEASTESEDEAQPESQEVNPNEVQASKEIDQLNSSQRPGKDLENSVYDEQQLASNGEKEELDRMQRRFEGLNLDADEIPLKKRIDSSNDKGNFYCTTSSSSSAESQFSQSSSSQLSSSSLFSSIFNSNKKTEPQSNKDEEEQVPVSKARSMFGSMFSRAKDTLSSVKSTLKDQASQVVTGIKQKVQDPDNQIRAQIFKEELRIKAQEASELVDRQGTYIKDYASTTYQQVKEKVEKSLKERKLDKEYKEIKTNLRHKYLDISFKTENYANKKMRQITEYFHPGEAIGEEEYEKLEGEESTNETRQNEQEQTQFILQKKPLISSQDQLLKLNQDTLNLTKEESIFEKIQVEDEEEEEEEEETKSDVIPNKKSYEENSIIVHQQDQLLQSYKQEMKKKNNVPQINQFSNNNFKQYVKQQVIEEEGLRMNLSQVTSIWEPSLQFERKESQNKQTKMAFDEQESIFGPFEETSTNELSNNQNKIENLDESKNDAALFESQFGNDVFNSFIAAEFDSSLKNMDL